MQTTKQISTLIEASRYKVKICGGFISISAYRTRANLELSLKMSQVSFKWRYHNINIFTFYQTSPFVVIVDMSCIQRKTLKWKHVGDIIVWLFKLISKPKRWMNSSTDFLGVQTWSWSCRRCWSCCSRSSSWSPSSPTPSPQSSSSWKPCGRWRRQVFIY